MAVHACSYVHYIYRAREDYESSAPLFEGVWTTLYLLSYIASVSLAYNSSVVRSRATVAKTGDPASDSWQLPWIFLLQLQLAQLYYNIMLI